MSNQSAAFHEWARSAKVGADFVYHISGRPRVEKAFTYARKLSEGGLAFLFQRRAENGEWHYVARRTVPTAHDTLDAVSRLVNKEGTFCGPELRRQREDIANARRVRRTSFSVGAHAVRKGGPEYCLDAIR